MKYIVCQEPGNFELKHKPVPNIGKKDVLLNIKTIGICGTDLHAYEGNQPYFTYPRILGHELGASVSQVGEHVKDFQKGDKVVVMPYISCGHCISCSAGKTNCCTNIQVLGVHTDGGMQEQIVVPANILLKVNDLSFAEIAIIEPLAIAYHAIRRAEIKKGEYAVVMGCGPIGLGIMKLAQLQGAKVIALDVVEGRLMFAKEKFQVDHIVDVKDHPLDKIEKITDGNLATAVFDASGNKVALEKGPTYMTHGGRYILVGLSKGDLVYNHPAIHAKETTLMCSRNAVPEDFKNVIEILGAGRFPSKDYITHTVSFDDMINHFDEWLEPDFGVIKAMIQL